jgi:alanyl-tRNA synthetase
VLGEQAKQAGSWVGPEGLRFDFPASSATPREHLREVERRVNEQIRRNATVEPAWMSLGEAQQLGADMFFGEKYVPENVRVVQVDGFSRELCGGTHVASTGQIGSFRITGEASIGAGLRRIEAVTGEAADELVAERLATLHAVAAQLGVPEDQVAARVEALTARLREAEKGMRQPTERGVRLDAAAALAGAQQAGEVKVIVQHYPGADAAALRQWADDLRGMTGRFVAIGAGESRGPAVVVAASRDLVAEGFDAVAIIRQIGPLIDGGGGGRAELAQAGGRSGARLQDALAEAARLALEALSPIESG